MILCISCSLEISGIGTLTGNVPCCRRRHPARQKESDVKGNLSRESLVNENVEASNELTLTFSLLVWMMGFGRRSRPIARSVAFLTPCAQHA